MKDEVPHTAGSARRALALARKGCYSVAMKLLGSERCTSSDDIKALDDLVCCHPQHDLPTLIDKHCAPLIVDSAAIIQLASNY